MTKAEKTGEREVTFTFDAPGNRELPQIVGQLPVLPKHWWEGTDSERQQARHHRDDARAAARLRPLPRSRNSRPAAASSTSGSKDYWGKDSMSASARNNFDEIRYEYFRDSTVALEAFKADQVDWRIENSAKDWATAYDFPAVREKTRGARGIPDPQSRRHAGFRLQHRGATSSRIRAFAAPSTIAFDFEEMNKQIFFGQYKRIDSYFEGTELASIRRCRRARNWKSSRRVQRQGAGRSCSPSRTPIRSGGDQQALRDNLREALRLFARGRLRDQGHQAGQCQDRRAVHASSFWSTSRPASAVSCSTSRRWNASASP